MTSRFISGLLIGCAVWLGLFFASTVRADEIEVTFVGEVEFNGIGAAPLGNILSGDPCLLRFRVDSDLFQSMATTRGYPIDPSTFEFSFPTVSIPLQAAAVAGYFVLRNNDPSVDGFFFSTAVDEPLGVPLDQQGAFGQFRVNPSLAYAETTLPSLDILDALGSYDFSNVTTYNWSIDDGPFQAAAIIFESLTVELVSSVPEFRRGDANWDGSIGLSDALVILQYGFAGMPTTPECLAALDVDGDATVAPLTEALVLLSFLFLQGAPPTFPFPDCGVDPASTQALGCDGVCP